MILTSVFNNKYRLAIKRSFRSYQESLLLTRCRLLLDYQTANITRNCASAARFAHVCPGVGIIHLSDQQFGAITDHLVLVRLILAQRFVVL